MLCYAMLGLTVRVRVLPTLRTNGRRATAVTLYALLQKSVTEGVINADSKDRETD